MTSGEREAAVVAERARVLAEYESRERAIGADLYAPWNPAQALALAERRSAAAMLLHKAGAFPTSEDACLEVGVGRMGWLTDLLSWGVREGCLHGIDLAAERVEQARLLLPVADLRTGDATALPWPDGRFAVVVASTVFSSILHEQVRQGAAQEICRVLRPGGALLWYDFAVDNPRNKQVRGVALHQLRRYFPNLRGPVQRITLAPPISRAIAPWSPALAKVLGSVPFLRTHLLAALRKAA
jgi:ubiquinone/menaquinone biosynthesis C-methylase UbiE